MVGWLAVSAGSALLLSLAGWACYRLGYERGKRSFGVVWRKAPEHVLRQQAARAAADRGGPRARQRRVLVRPTARDRTSING